MLEWAWPWAFAALVLPWLVRAWLPPARAGARGAVAIPFLAELRQLDAGAVRAGGALPAWALLAWSALCIAAARPQWVGEVELLPLTGRDLMLAVDVSGSMAAEDMRVGGRAVDRLTAVQAVVGDFLSRRQGDRVGLLLFGQQAYLMSPLTFDLASVRYQLETSTIGLAGRETAIGDAIGLAVKRFREAGTDQRVLILLTDGVNTAGALAPEQATELALAERVRIYTVGIGGESRPAGMLGMMFAQPAEIDEPGLRRIAAQTGGRYYRARDTRELAGIYAEIDRLEPAAQEGESLRPRRELFPWPLAASLLLSMTPLLLQAARRRGALKVRPT